MKTTFLTAFVLLLLFTTLVQAQNPTFLWAKQIGGIGSQSSSSSNSIATDVNGGVFTSGRFSGTVDFDPGATTMNLTAIGFDNVFIQKLDASGNFQWAKQLSALTFINCFSISTDALGNVYASGQFSGTVDFNPGTAIVNLTSNSNDMFLLKLDASGNFQWAIKIGGMGNESGFGIANDAAGNVYVTGLFENTVDFNPGAGTANRTSFGGSSSNIFILKLDASGNFLWVQQMGGTSSSSGNSITIDALGNVLSTGYFYGTVDLDPGVGTVNFSTVNTDAYIQKLDSNGNFLWAKQIGGNSGSSIYTLSITTDGFGDVYTTGAFAGTVDFDPGATTTNFTSMGFNDVFIQKLDTSGNFIWAKQMGGTNTEFGYSINTDINNNVYTTGTFRGTIDFDPGTGTTNLTSTGQRNMFIQKLSASGSFIWAKQTIGVGSNTAGFATSIEANGNIYTSGTFSGTVDFNPGAATANLTAIGVEEVFIQKLYECQNNSATDTVTACGSYTWIDNITYSASNNSATFTLTNAGGCDSVVTLDLTINNVTDLTTSVVGFIITANNTNATYQWLLCDNNHSIIANETNQSFTATANGNYAVEITENGCIDTSACVNISTIGIDEPSTANKFIVYPDPTHGEFFIKFETTQSELSVRIKSISGQTIENRTCQNTDFVQLQLDQPAGVYLVEVSNETGETAVIRMIKK